MSDRAVQFTQALCRLLWIAQARDPARYLDRGTIDVRHLVPAHPATTRTTVHLTEPDIPSPCPNSYGSRQRRAAQETRSQVALHSAAMAEAIATPDRRVSMGTVVEVAADFARLIR